MFEHVGLAGFDEFFAHANRLLAADGIMLLHAIGRNEPPRPTHPWIEKYIFPGGYLAPVSEVSASIERAGLKLTDIEILRAALCRNAQALAQPVHGAARRSQGDV